MRPAGRPASLLFGRKKKKFKKKREKRKEKRRSGWAGRHLNSKMWKRLFNQLEEKCEKEKPPKVPCKNPFYVALEWIYCWSVLLKLIFDS
jgi:hypothetical protein